MKRKNTFSLKEFIPHTPLFVFIFISALIYHAPDELALEKRALSYVAGVYASIFTKDVEPINTENERELYAYAETGITENTTTVSKVPEHPVFKVHAYVEENNELENTQEQISVESAPIVEVLDYEETTSAIISTNVTTSNIRPNIYSVGSGAGGQASSTGANNAATTTQTANVQATTNSNNTIQNNTAETSNTPTSLSESDPFLPQVASNEPRQRNLIIEPYDFPDREVAFFEIKVVNRP